MKLTVATHNPNKVREIREILPGFEIAAEDSAAEETELTFKGNALLKARSLKASHPGEWILADDSGLEVAALNGEPGVRSARYAGEDGNTAKNNALLLKRLEGVSDRRARFVCAVALISPKGVETVVEGYCEGRILAEASGSGGFGYDPLFVPDGHEQTFAELGAEAKNKISHRARAIAKAKSVILSA